MSSILRHFNVFRDIPPNIQQNVKSFFVFENTFGFCVTNHNNVYAFGDNIHEKFAYNENNDNISNNYVLIRDLCDHNIEEFFEGYGCFYAKNDEDHIWGWGSNDCGQLCRGHISEEMVDDDLKPQKIDFFDDKHIIHMNYYEKHCLALSSEGSLYGWAECKDKCILQPIVLKVDNWINIKNISNTCLMNLFALTFDGIIWEFCENIKTNEEFSDQKIISFEWKLLYNFIEITQFIDNYEPNIEHKVNNLCVENGVICETENNCVFVFSDNNIEKTIYKTIFEYFLYEHQSTYKTIQIKENKLFEINLEKGNSGTIFTKVFKEIHTFIYNFDLDVETNSSLSSLRVFNDLHHVIESKVKCFYSSRLFALFVMNDNNVYSFGSESNGLLGLGDKNRVLEYTIVPELCDQNIEEFYCGSLHMFARNDKNQIFSWGKNYYGQLARGFKSDSRDECLKPCRIEFFDNKNIVNIVFSDIISEVNFALSSDGLVYGWGQNKFNIIETNVSGMEIITTPILLDLKTNISFVDANSGLLLAVTFQGDAFYRGFKNGSIPITNVSKMSYFPNRKEQIIVLDNNGLIFLYYISNETTINIKCDVTFIDLYHRLLQSEDCVFQLKMQQESDSEDEIESICDFDGELEDYLDDDQDNTEMDYNEIDIEEESNTGSEDEIDMKCDSDFEMDEILIKTNFINFYDFYSQQLTRYPRTVHITHEGYLMTNEIQFNEDENTLNIVNKYIFDNKFENTFEEIKEIGSGSFGAVHIVRKNINQVLYAIKRIEVDGELDLKEIQIISKLDSNFIVQYIDSWIEAKVIFKKIKKFLFIQMDLCSHNFRLLLKSLNEINEQKFYLFNYFISCDLFKELIECVNYLHSLNPPIIHRDLKPENILISDGINGRFLKLCDFGLSQIQEKSVYTRMVGTDTYMAPEVRDSRNYNTKSDIYSLALIGTEIFKFPDQIRRIKKFKNLNDYSTIYSKTIFDNQFKILLKLIEVSLFSEHYEERPDSKQLLIELDQILIDKSIVINDTNINIFKDTLANTDNILAVLFEYKLDSSSLFKISIEQIVSDANVISNVNQYHQEQSNSNTESIYEDMFDEISELGSGSFGTVFEVKNKLTNERFAIKKIKIDKESDSKEMKNILNLINNNKYNDFIVQFINIWIERQRIFNSNTEYLFIQMELCAYNLQDLIKLMSDQRDNKEFLPFNYFISCELLKELTECVNYLHSLNPPIIHRDLKPENILISDRINRRFLKLCDFGLSQIHEKSSHTRMVGTDTYMAPEVRDYRNYNLKSDVYSLALIATEIFLFEDSVKKIRDKKIINKYLSKYLNTNLENNFRQLFETLSTCLFSKYHNLRPSCEDLLDKIKEFSIEKNILLNNTNISYFMIFLNREDNFILKNFFQAKL